MTMSRIITKSIPFIPERFKKVIAIHLVKNFMVQKVVNPPLILGIHGASGIGKTYQCELVLQEMKVKSFLISGGQLENEEAGKPGQIIREAYLDAGRSLQKKEANAAVVLINDIDTGVGDWGEMVQYTVNRQIVFGELMHLVDYPTRVKGYGTQRIPIIITGNDFSKLYEPLVRAGRMTAFKWEPTFEEKVEIVARIFPEISENKNNCHKLVLEFNSQPVAFFSHLRDTLADEIVWQSISSVGIEHVFEYMSNGQNPYVNLQVSYPLLIKAGHNLLQSGKLINHLSR